MDPATGNALPNNPLIANSDPNARRIIAYGLRNPFRQTLVARPGTDEIWVGDVGLIRWDEINRIANPTDSTVENFGWPCYEGNDRQPSFDGANLNICENLYGRANAVSGATQVAAGVNVSATFSEAMDARTTDGDPSTINSTTFKLVKLNSDGTTTRITAAVSYDATTKKAILNPSSNLISGRTYKATVTSGAQDMAGNALDQNPTLAGNQPKSWKFKVQ